MSVFINFFVIIIIIIIIIIIVTLLHGIRLKIHLTINKMKLNNVNSLYYQPVYNSVTENEELANICSIHYSPLEMIQ